MICADRRWPETARALRLKGAKLILNPHVWHAPSRQRMVGCAHRGYENECFIAFAHPEVSFVVNPKGDLAAKRDDDPPGILVCATWTLPKPPRRGTSTTVAPSFTASSRNRNPNP